MSEKQEIKQLAQDILGIRKQEFRVRTALAGFGVDQASMPALLDLMGAVYEVGWNDHCIHQATRTHKTRTPRRTRTTRKRTLQENGTFRDLLAKTMGKKPMTIAAIFNQLKAQGWKTDSKDPLSRIATTLSTHKDLFEHVGDRCSGMYCVVNGKATPSTPTNGGNGKSSHASLQDLVTTARKAISKHFRSKTFRAADLCQQAGCPPTRISAVLYELRKEGVIQSAVKRAGHQSNIWKKA